MDTQTVRRVYLFGELHGEKLMYETELAAWQYLYHTQGMRHLFIENSYPAAQLLNIWMHKGDDAILLELYKDWEGTEGHTEDNLTFHQEIKKTCPKTVFHGIDVSHQHKKNGLRYLKLLENSGLADSEQYLLAKENAVQADAFYRNKPETDEVNWALREKFMAANFIRELDSLPSDTNAMGIFGRDHLVFDKDTSETVPSFIRQIEVQYGHIFRVIDLAGKQGQPGNRRDDAFSATDISRLLD